jgi:hypothetical protein
MVPEALAQAQTHPQTQNQQQQDKTPQGQGCGSRCGNRSRYYRERCHKVTVKVDFQAGQSAATSPERHLPTTTEGVRHLGAAVVRWSIGECNQKPILKSHIEPAL